MFLEQTAVQQQDGSGLQSVEPGGSAASLSACDAAGSAAYQAH
jgi:hypothetical protein